jgi:hypothetical protein
VGKIRAFLFKYRSQLLMWLFIALMATSPLTDARPWLVFVTDVLYLSLLVVGASYMAERWIVRIIVYPLATLWMLAHIIQIALDPKFYVSPYIGLALSCAIIWGILARFSLAVKISGNAVAEAIICYLVIAVAFSQAYWILNRVFSDAFNMRIPAKQQSAYLYFSLTTLTTLGSGDIEPMNHYVRFLAAFESLAGTFYLAIVIARLVAGYRLKGAEE